jgi:hypothetical protein
MDVDWLNTCEEQPERMRNLAKELRLAFFPQVSARKFRNWSTEAQRAVDSCLLLADFVVKVVGEPGTARLAPQKSSESRRRTTMKSVADLPRLS